MTVFVQQNVCRLKDRNKFIYIVDTITDDVPIFSINTALHVKTLHPRMHEVTFKSL